MAQQTGAIYHQGILYSGGSGTNVTPNPQGEATDTLNTVEIDGTVYDIEGGGGGGSNLIIDAQKYSLDEQVVGIWTDGKPLYQKTLYSATTVIGASTNFFDLSALYIDEMVDWHGNFIRDGKNYSVDMVEKPSSSSANTYARCRYVPDTKQFAVNVADFNGYPTSFGRLYVTIKYTKTTDTAGSGGYQAYGFSPIVCSDAEREVGVWEDNKPLYQKTFIGTLGGTVGSDVSNYKMADLSDIDTIASISGTLQGITPINSYYASDNYNMVFVNGAKNGLYCNGKNIGGNTYKVTIQYTKASDTAGSGEYNTLAIPNVHYDGEEKVIGTWFGETLYEKTWDFGSNLTVDDSWMTTTIPNANISRIINTMGMSDSGSCFNGGLLAARDTGSYVLFRSTRNSGTLGIRYATLQYTKTTD